MPSDTQKAFLGEASETYHKAAASVPAVVDYLTQSRGLSRDRVRYHQIGYVESPLPGHEKYRGKLSIPYLTRGGVVTIRFRCIGEIDHPEREKCEGHAKYLSLPGDVPRIYHPAALHAPSRHIAICEGEFDAMTASGAGIPAVGLPGVSSFRDYMTRLFVGYQTVYILADADDKGQGAEFADKLAGRIPSARICLMPEGHDVNSFVLANGPDALLERLEIRK